MEQIGANENVVEDLGDRKVTIIVSIVIALFLNNLGMNYSHFRKIFSSAK